MMPRRNIDEPSSHPVEQSGIVGASPRRFTSEEIGKLHSYLSDHRDDWAKLDAKIKKNATLTDTELAEYKTLSGVIRVLERQLVVKEKPSTPLAVERKKTKWEELIDKRDEAVDNFFDQLKEAVQAYMRDHQDKDREQEDIDKKIKFYRQKAKEAMSSESRITALESAEAPVKRLMTLKKGKSVYESFFPGGREIKGHIRALDVGIIRTPQPKNARGANRLRIPQQERTNAMFSDEEIELESGASIEEIFGTAK